MILILVILKNLCVVYNHICTSKFLYMKNFETAMVEDVWVLCMITFVLLNICCMRGMAPAVRKRWIVMMC